VKFFYFYAGCSQSALIAAYIHLQKLPGNRVPTIQEILLIPEFKQDMPRDLGVPHFIAEDYRGDAVYTVDFGKNYVFALQTVNFILKKQGLDLKEWRFINVGELFNNLWIKMGILMNDIFKISWLGKYLIAVGIRKNYQQLSEHMSQSLKRES
jgi:hypothetical protein